MNSIEIEPDRLLHEGRRSLIVATGKAIDLDDVKRPCETYGTDFSGMTSSRLFARFMSRFWFYNPLAGHDKSSYTKSGKLLPSIDAAWAYMEHVTLARHYTDENLTSSTNSPYMYRYTRAEVGEMKRPTDLYPLWKTPVKELMAWGVSVRMYFSTLLLLSIFLTISAFLNIPLIVYFWTSYTEDNKDGIMRAIKGSAVCDEAYWVACEECNNEYAYAYPEYRLDGNNVLVNNCNFEDWLIPGICSFVSSIVLIIMFGIAYFWLQRKAEIVFDEEIQTASDYSLKVSNPPRDALDPEEWRHFFKPFAPNEIVMVTIAVDNSMLIETLVQRRKTLRQLHLRLRDFDVDVDDEKALRNFVDENAARSVLPFIPTSKKLYEKVQQYNQRVRNLLMHDFGAVAVFVVFDTERAQRTCLHALSTGRMNVWKNNVDTSRFDGREMKAEEAAVSSTLEIINIADVCQPEETKEVSIRLVRSSSSVSVREILRFRGTQVLSIKEPGEPNDVRWKDLEISARLRSLLFLSTTIIMIIFIAWSGFFIADLERKFPGSPRTALYITITNMVVPVLCDFVTSLEAHTTEAQRSVSLYIKVALFRWFNSAICLLLIIDFIHTISVEEDGNKAQETSLPKTVYMIIYAEMFTVPVIKLLDITGNIRKHILAPRAADQEEMNSYFRGSKFELAERYSDATKVLFVSLFYSTIIPESFLLGAIALCAHYWSGKYCLLRFSRTTSDIGPHLARVSRNYFFSTSLIAHVVMSAYFWSGYPYDQVCEVDGTYQYCNQDFFRSLTFPPLPQFQPEGMEWMRSSQEILTSLYGYTSIAMVSAAAFLLITRNVVPYIKSIFSSSYEPDGEDQGIRFSSVKRRHEVHGYIPQVTEKGFVHPLLACDISKVDHDLIGWRDNIHGFEPHNLFNDVRKILGGEDPPPYAFSIVKDWAGTQHAVAEDHR